jgi:hypothetical protein
VNNSEAEAEEDNLEQNSESPVIITPRAEIVTKKISP